MKTLEISPLGATVRRRMSKSQMSNNQPKTNFNNYERSLELRERVVPVVLGLARVSEADRVRKSALVSQFPAGLLKLSALQSGGLDKPEDILCPDKPEACYTHAIHQAILRAHDEYEADRLWRRSHRLSGRAQTVYCLAENTPLNRQRARGLFEAYVQIYLLRYRLDASVVRTLSARARELTGPQWRAFFYNSDVYFRAGVYEWLRQERSPAFPWHEIRVDVVPSVADDAHDLLYGDGLRIFHAYKDKDEYLAVPTRHDLDADLIRGFMRDEVRKIVERERISYDFRSRGIFQRIQDLPEWRTVRPFDAEGLWAFSAKNLEHEKE